MRAQYVHIHDLAKRALVADGDFCEAGVWYCTTFCSLAELARQNGRACHGVDSFCGMPDNGPRDAGKYRRGSLCGLDLNTAKRLTRQFNNVSLHAGFVPEVLDEMADCLFAFVHLDLDQYESTRAALPWFWSRMDHNGILCCHDYYEDRGTLAAGAIADWMKESGEQIAGTLPSNHCWFHKR